MYTTTETNGFVYKTKICYILLCTIKCIKNIAEQIYETIEE